VEDPDLARLRGIRSDLYTSYAIGIGSFLAAAAAISSSFESGLSPTMGFNALIKGAIATVIGGTGGMQYVALGGLFLGIVENLGVYWLPSEWQDSIAFGLLILFLVFRPFGINGQQPTKQLA